MLARFPTAALLAAVAFLTACSGSTVADDGPSQANPLDAEEDSLFFALNNFRADNGIDAVVATCTSLNVAASAHSDDMRDNGYLSDKAPDGSTARERACDAGFKAACDPNAAFAELVASGIDAGSGTLQQWANDATTKEILLNANLIVGGVGRSLATDGARWTLDLAATDEASCH